jgi:transposase
MRYSNDLRNRAIDLLKSGKTVKELVILLKIGEDTLYKWRKKSQAGTLLDIYIPNGRPVKYDMQGLKLFIENNNDKSIREIKTEFFEANGNKASFGGIHKALKKLKLSFKKNSTL